MSVRFAPSPTGTFHLGNLRTAWISHHFAEKLGMPWVVRFEDIDTPRVLQGSMESQLADMRALGLEPDRILVQSENHARHLSLFEQAAKSGAIYPCSCSRKEVLESLRQMASAPHGEAPIYDGRCRDPKHRKPAAHPTLAWRFLNPEDPSGHQDFVVARTNAEGGEFAPSYHWACAIDDYDGDHALLVRAWDLEHVIPQQRLIHQWMGKRVEKQEATHRPYPAVFHCSLVVADDGHRLEKRTRGVTMSELQAAGVSPREIAERFATSFDEIRIREFAPGKIWGEDARQCPVRLFATPSKI
jgi:glutamyl/glutaminyl-tRNA synthetase